MGANDIVDRVNVMFSLPIISRGVGTRHAKVDATSEEEGAGARVIKLTAIVALNFDRGTKLCGNKCKEIGC